MSQKGSNNTTSQVLAPPSSTKLFMHLFKHADVKRQFEQESFFFFF